MPFHKCKNARQTTVEIIGDTNFPDKLTSSNQSAYQTRHRPDLAVSETLRFLEATWTRCCAG